MTLKGFVLAAAILPVLPAGAQSVLDQPRQVYDLQKFTCKQLMDLPTDGLGIRFIYWLDGNYRADDNTVIDTDVHKKMLLDLAGHCKDNPDDSVSAAAEKLFHDKK